MDLIEVMRTTFAAREFTDDPVPDEVLSRILGAARFAPSGGNRQGWRVIVVRDPGHRRTLCDLVVPTMRRCLAQMVAGEVYWNSIVPSRITEADVEAVEPPVALVERMVNAPVLLIVAVDLSQVASFDKDLERVGVVSGASIYPFVWNILLAARNEGLGGTLTTFVVPEEQKARELLGLPEHYAIAAMLPIGKPVKQLTKLRRNPVESFATIDRFDGEPLRG